MEDISYKEKGTYVTNEIRQDADVGQLEEYRATPVEERKVLRKLDIFLLPTIGLCYMLQYMDKLALSQVTPLRLQKDLSILEGPCRSTINVVLRYLLLWVSGLELTNIIFDCSSSTWEVLGCFCLSEVPDHGSQLTYALYYRFLWGGILMCHAACKSYGGFITHLSQGNLDSSIEKWRLLFLILGAVTSGYAVLLFSVLADSPATASFLTPIERTIEAQRTLKAFQWSQVWEAARDPQVLCLVIYTFLVNIGNGGLTSVSTVVHNLNAV
ncbi:hypothetical protein N7495_003729 [Penicillium taxi]|uniref:uncharacterized protein n=1 Tax=Penicillium taxi TaxID=168475 RepID=UPI0025454682|nr:uncharacterized protein N7495_003729 [Penicillium taxi]KAJ5898985.1 hypothetical protein N7495_003729 [Penicillium taxi]